MASLSITSYSLRLDTSSYSRTSLIERDLVTDCGVGASYILCCFIHSINQTKSFLDTVLLTSVLALMKIFSFNMYLGV